MIPLPPVLEAPATAWAILAALLAAAELLAPGFSLIWLAIAAGITAAATALFALPGFAELALFAAAATVSVRAGRRMLAQPPLGDDPLLNERPARMIGLEVTVSEALVAGRGRVSVGDGSWLASGPDLPAGTRARVVGVRGARLLIEPLEAPPIAGA